MQNRFHRARTPVLTHRLWKWHCVTSFIGRGSSSRGRVVSPEQRSLGSVPKPSLSLAFFENDRGWHHLEKQAAHCLSTLVVLTPANNGAARQIKRRGKGNVHVVKKMEKNY